jgi:uncharacterized membrane protein YeaQ/YmgE (transglycosylase-associated protein family)
MAALPVKRFAPRQMRTPLGDVRVCPCREAWKARLTTALVYFRRVRRCAAHAAGQELSLRRRIMDISLVDLAIETIFGAVGGYIAGTAIRDLSLGTVGNLIAGAIGGLISGYSLRAAIPVLASSASWRHLVRRHHRPGRDGTCRRRNSHGDCRFKQRHDVGQTARLKPSTVHVSVWFEASSGIK